jgi:hypothetical protein
MRTPCYRATAGEQKTWADLFAAVGHRDAMDIVQLTRRLLQQDGSRTNDERAYLTALGAAACVGLGQMGDARALLAVELPRIAQPPEYRVPLGELITRVQQDRGQP